MDGLTCPYFVVALLLPPLDASPTQLAAGLVWWRLLRSGLLQNVAPSQCPKRKLGFSPMLVLRTTSLVSMARLEHILHSRGLLCPAVPRCTFPLYVSAPKLTPPTYPSEHGLATHYIPSARVSMLLESLSTIEKPTYSQVNEAIEDLHYDRESVEPVAPLSGGIRVALDSAFSQETVEDIVAALENITGDNAGADVVQWAKDTLAILEERSPTSLKIALMAIRKGKSLDLLESFKMELGIAAAFCVGSFYWITSA